MCVCLLPPFPGLCNRGPGFSIKDRVVKLTVQHHTTEISGTPDEIKLVKKSLRLWVPNPKDKTQFYSIQINRGNVFLTGYLSKLKAKLAKKEIQFSVEDKRSYPGVGKEKLSMKAEFDLMPHQEAALAAVKEEPVGVISCPTASGKSEIIYRAIDYYKHVTLIVVPNESIQFRMQKDLQKYYGTKNVSIEVPNRPPPGILEKMMQPRSSEGLPKKKSVFAELYDTEKKSVKLDFGYSNDDELSEKAPVTKKKIDFGYSEEESEISPLKKKGLQSRSSLKTRKPLQSRSSLGMSAKKAWHQPITILCYHSLPKLPQWYLDLIAHVMIDECHTGATETIRAALMRMPNAAYKHGFSATPWRDAKHEIELLRAALGDKIIYEYKVEDAIDDEVVANLEYNIINADTPEGFLKNLRNPRDIMERGIINNVVRNRQIVKKAMEEHSDNRGVFIAIDEIAHGDILVQMFEAKGIKPYFLHGQLKDGVKQSLIEELFDFEGPYVCIGTMAVGIGTDIPTINSVILGSWGKSTIRFIQRIGRGMRADTLKVFDFWDWFNNSLKKHSLERLRTFRKYYKKSAMF